RSPWRLVIRDAVISRARWHFGRMGAVPGIGFLAAFEPARRAGPPAPPGRGVAVRADGVRLDGVDATLDFDGWGLTLRAVRGLGDIAASPEGGLRFEVRDADASGGGVLRVLGGADALRLVFSRARLEKIASTATVPGGDNDSIALRASNVITGQSVLALEGRFLSVLGNTAPPGGPSIDLIAGVAGPADAMAAVGARHLPAGVRLAGGPASSLTASFHGRLAAPMIDVAGQGLVVGYRDVDFHSVAFDVLADLGAGRLRVRHLAMASPAGGRMEMSGAIDGRQLAVRLVFEHLRWPLIPGAPPYVAALADSVLQGIVAVTADRAGPRLAVGELALDWTRPPGASGPRTIRLRSPGQVLLPREKRAAWNVRGAGLANGVLEIPVITVPLAGGRVKARGRVRLLEQAAAPAAPTIDFSLVATHVSLAEALGQGFVTGTVSLRARVRGLLDNLAIAVTAPAGQRVRVLGEPYRLPTSATLRLAHQRVSISTLRFDDEARVRRGDADRYVAAAGTIGFGGELDLDVTMSGFPFGGLPALAEAALPFSGRLSGSLRVRGQPGEHAITGALTVDGALFQGRPIGGGRLEITPRPHGAIRARGPLIEGVALDGVLEPGTRGLRGEATLTLSEVRLDPFLAGIPGELSAAGIVSGQVDVRLAAGQPSVNARLTRLTLAVTIPFLAPAPPPAPTPAGTAAAGARTIALEARGDVSLSVKQGDLRLLPARFIGPAGDLEISAERRGGASLGRVKGRISLAGLAPLAVRWLDQLVGDIDLDLSATAASADARPAISGFIAVGQPLSVQVSGLPVAVRVPQGRLELTGAAMRTAHLSITADGSPFDVSGVVALVDRGSPALSFDVAGMVPASLIGKFVPRRAGLNFFGGTARVSAHVDGTVARPRWRGRVVPDDLVLAVPDLGPERLRIRGGELTVDPDAIGVRNVEIRLGTAIRATVGASRAGVVKLSELLPPRVRFLSLPLAGTVSALAVPSVTVEEGTFALTLAGDPGRRLRLTGDLDLRAARVRSGGTSAGQGGAPSALSRVDLDVHVHSGPGALTIEVPHAPDVRVGVDLQVTGSAAHPQPAGRVRPAGAYSHVAVFLYRLFH
ncbi:MAG TPA: hypothetical protein VNO55_23555, partial [Polyangia bacterium]|nr:hypothetical protein [Polyangia bacterium]